MKTSLKILFTFALFFISSTNNAQDLFQAIEAGEYEKVEQFLLNEPKLVDSIVKWDCTPLMLASYYGKDTIVELLLKIGANMYKADPMNGQTPMHIAAIRNSLPVVEILLSYGIDVNVKDGDNKTALIYAIEKNHKEIIGLLLQNDAKFPKEEDLINLCLHSAVLNNLQDISDQLLKNKAPLSGVDKYGRSLLHNAIIANNLKWIDLLISKNNDINALDSFSRSPLHYSVELNQFDNTKTLVQNGAKINSIDCSNRTPLNIAHGLVHSEITALLESEGAILSAPMVIKIKGDTNKHSEIKVTYIANMGVLISSGSKTVLIDAIFNESYYNYSITPKNVVTKLNNNEEPYDSIDLILVTHSDGDHFSAPMIADYLAINPSVKVVCNTNTALALKNSIDSGVDSTRIVGITPELCNSTDTLVNDIEVKVLRLRHSGRDDQNDNLGFLLEMDGIKVFHQGDSGGNVKQGLAVSRIHEYDSIGIAAMNIDLAILNRGSLGWSKTPGIEVIKNLMKPKHIILTHFSDYNKQGEWERVDKTIRNHTDELPDITLFKWQMQDIIIQKGR